MRSLDWSVGRRLGIGFGAILLLLLAQLLVAIHHLREASLAAELPPEQAIADRIYQKHEELLDIFVLSSSLIFGVGATSALMTIRAVKSRTWRLVEAARALENGDFEQLKLSEPPKLAHPKDELDELAGAFQRMASALSNRQKELQNLADELRSRNVQLATTHQRKDEFLAMLAHELRSPLGALGNAVGGLEQFWGPDSGAAELIALLRRQTEKLVRMVDDLTDVSSIAHGKVELRLSSIDLNEVARRALETARPFLDARNHTLAWSPASEPLWIRADGNRLEQVIINLLNNAAKYTEPGGRISLELGRRGQEALLKVKDNGCGIRPEALSHIFDLFTQLDRPPGQAPRGLGIGLTLVRKLIQSHGGTISASSEGLGRGSCFEVCLPLLLPEPSEPRRSISELPARRILIVDDHQDAASSLAMILRRWGQEVQVVAAGASALLECERFQPELVLLDLGLPDIDGYEVARSLKSKGQSLLVALTGQSLGEGWPRAQAAGFDHYLLKPAPLEEIRRLLEEVAAR